MTVDPLLLMPEVDRATERLLRTADRLDDAAARGPSLLPGWTRGHVLTHLARQADAQVNLLTSARTGEVIPAYRDEQARATDIAAGADRSPADLAADLRAAAARLVDACAAMPPQAWSAQVIGRRGPQPAATVLWGRLREVEVHHVDLAAGYAPIDWPAAFAHRLLHEVTADLDGRPGRPALVLRPCERRHELTVGEPEGAPTVSGPAYAIAAWLTGRGDGDGLTVSPDGPLPTPPEWI
ncbi:maleylpyruvate isomerase family mycothiol-dependent enzyme [Plantactinospora sp. KBS50]|uniref:maleylpyruvate isomerase family mycothiol-dependent enzyme n=1 Tax=Plantactinospora sp. KBS50 TaxID=2024580 RepID=UPI000BAAA54D|nr:maleylpyruvate isomerase family mycothiol-dependent enzyme [Plantactinospora sp. KBS50]ASW55948.1 maleylpyruvate isomerase [Plantactinospora sp. KBS50]